MKDFVTDINDLPKGLDCGFVHLGFQRQTDRLVQSAFIGCLLNNHQFKGYSMRVTGHSMGGACAQLLTYRALDQVHQLSDSLMDCVKGKIRRPRIACIAIAAPFWASQKIQDNILGRKWSSFFVCIVNEGDCVPGLTNISNAISRNFRTPSKVHNFIQKMDVPGVGSVIFAGRALISFANWIFQCRNFFSSLTYYPVGVYEYIRSEKGIGASYRHLNLDSVSAEHFELLDVLSNSAKITMESVNAHSLEAYGANLKRMKNNFFRASQGALPREISSTFIVKPKIEYIEGSKLYSEDKTTLQSVRLSVR